MSLPRLRRSFFLYAVLISYLKSAFCLMVHVQHPQSVWSGAVDPPQKASSALRQHALFLYRYTRLLLFRLFTCRKRERQREKVDLKCHSLCEFICWRCPSLAAWPSFDATMTRCRQYTYIPKFMHILSRPCGRRHASIDRRRAGQAHCSVDGRTELLRRMTTALFGHIKKMFIILRSDPFLRVRVRRRVLVGRGQTENRWRRCRHHWISSLFMCYFCSRSNELQE